MRVYDRDRTGELMNVLVLLAETFLCASLICYKYITCVIFSPLVSAEITFEDDLIQDVGMIAMIALQCSANPFQYGDQKRNVVLA